MTDQPIKPDPDKKPKRPRDANQLAKNIVDLATGQAEEVDPDAGKDPKAVKRGKAGGAERAKRLSPEERADISAKAALKRWGTKKKEADQEQREPDSTNQKGRC